MEGALWTIPAGGARVGLWGAGGRTGALGQEGTGGPAPFLPHPLLACIWLPRIYLPSQCAFSLKKFLSLIGLVGPPVLLPNAVTRLIPPPHNPPPPTAPQTILSWSVSSVLRILFGGHRALDSDGLARSILSVPLTLLHSGLMGASSAAGEQCPGTAAALFFLYCVEPRSEHRLPRPTSQS